MNRIFKLTLNEFLRNIKKVSTFVIIILTALVIFGFGAIVQNATNNRAQFRLDNAIAGTNPDNQSAMSQQLTYLQNQISQAVSDADKAIAQSQYDILNAAYQKGIYVAIASIPTSVQFSDPVTYQEVAVLNAINSKVASLSSKSTDLDTISGQYLDSALNSNFNEFITADNASFVYNSGLPESDPTNQAYIYANSLRLQYDVTNLDAPGSGTKNDLVSDIYNNKVGLIQGINPATSAVLTDTDIANANDNIPIDTYKLDHNIVASENIDVTIAALNSQIPPNLVGLGISIVSILMAILAGSTIAQEIATGAIKSLIIAPVKRWKIFLSKFLAITVLAILLDLLVYLVSAVTSLVFYGNSLESYFKVIGGQVAVIQPLLYIFYLTLLRIPELIIFIILAMMLSTLTRNTAISISIVVAFGLIGNTVVTVLANFFKGEWLKFMPFQHFSDLASKIFPTPAFTFGSRALRVMVNNTTPSIPVTSLTFSIVYLIVVFVLMYYTAHESFVKKDI